MFLPTLYGCGAGGCVGCTSQEVPKPRPLTIQEVIGTYEVSARLTQQGACEDGAGEAASTQLRYLTIERAPASDPEPNDGTESSDQVILTYRLCESLQECTAQPDPDRTFLWDAQQARAMHDVPQVALNQVGPVEQVCTLQRHVSALTLTPAFVLSKPAPGATEPLTLRIEHRTYQGRVIMEGEEACTSALVAERESLLECVVLEELTATRLITTLSDRTP